jgi:hypothetical protein
MAKMITKEKGFISKTLLFIIIILLISDAIVFENKIINKIKENIPNMIESVSNFIESNENEEKNKKDETFDKEDIRYTKNCKEIVEGMGMGEQLLKESDKETNIRYHQTNGNDLMISIGKDGSCTIKEVE